MNEMPSCRAQKQGAACGKPAHYRVTFPDGDTVPTCQACALDLQEIARDLKAPLLKIEPLTQKTTP
jgi:hypothetical protein